MKRAPCAPLKESKTKIGQEMLGMGLEMCALYASEIKQDKERAVTGSRLCAMCASNKK